MSKWLERWRGILNACVVVFIILNGVTIAHQSYSNKPGILFPVVWMIVTLAVAVVAGLLGEPPDKEVGG